MKKDNKEFYEVIEKLEVLKTTPERNQDQIIKGRSAFLSQAKEIAANVSPEPLLRHKNWKTKHPINLLVRKKERVPMLSTLTSIILAISLLLGGSGATVAAAQASEPGDLLYNIKLLSENAALELTSNPDSQFEIALQLVDRRANEIISLLNEGETITDETITIYGSQIEKAFLLALNLPEDKAILAFEKIQERLLVQQQALTQTRITDSDAAASMLQTREMLQERLQLLDGEQSNLLQIMEQIRIQEQIQNPETGNSPTNFGESAQNTPNLANGNANNTVTPSINKDNGQNNNPWISETPSPISTDGQNSTNGPGSTQGNPNNSTNYDETPNQGPNNSSGSQSGNH